MTVQIIIGIVTLFASVGAMVLGLFNRQTLVEVQKQTNGMLEKLEAAAEARGREEEKNSERILE